MKVTRKIVAEKANVSEATVSYVINDSKYVSPELKTRVKKCIEELNYYPDYIARSMVKKESQQISVYVFDISNPYFGELISGIELAAIEKGYFVNICSGNIDIKKYISNIIARRIDGVYIATTVSDEYKKDIKKLLDNNIKVLISSYYKNDFEDISHIDIDTSKGVYEQVECLKDLGHNKLAYLSAFKQEFKLDGRLDGYKLANKELLGCENPIIIYSEGKIETTVNSGYYLCDNLLSQTKDFTAILTTNDLMAFGVIRRLKEENINVPRDVSVIGFDNISIDECFSPKLASSGVSTKEMGKKIFDILYNDIKQNKIENIMIKPKIFLRETVSNKK